jgi:hypothetical protein
MSSTLPLFDAGASDLRKEIDAELRKPWSRYASEDVCSSRHRGSPTSEDANDELGPHAKAHLRELVLDVLRMRGTFGGTTEEVARHLNMQVHSISGRMSELKRDGLAIETDRRRKTRSGFSAAVCVAAEFK